MKIIAFSTSLFLLISVGYWTLKYALQMKSAYSFCILKEKADLILLSDSMWYLLGINLQMRISVYLGVALEV